MWVYYSCYLYGLGSYFDTMHGKWALLFKLCFFHDIVKSLSTQVRISNCPCEIRNLFSYTPLVYCSAITSVIIVTAYMTQTFVSLSFYRQDGLHLFDYGFITVYDLFYSIILWHPYFFSLDCCIFLKNSNKNVLKKNVVGLSPPE